MIYNLAHNGNKLITFTIDGTTYQAIKGMTWREWINSKYASSVQTRQCPSCGATEYFGEHNFNYTVASGKAIGWLGSSPSCEACIFTDEFYTSEPVRNNFKIIAGANYTIRTACAD